MNVLVHDLTTNHKAKVAISHEEVKTTKFYKGRCMHLVKFPYFSCGENFSDFLSPIVSCTPFSFWKEICYEMKIRSPENKFLPFFTKRLFTSDVQAFLTKLLTVQFRVREIFRIKKKSSSTCKCLDGPEKNGHASIVNKQLFVLIM